MGTTYNSPPLPATGVSVFIATASYDSVKMGYAECLAESVIELTRRGIPIQLGLMHGNCHVDDGRNAMVRDFLNSNCTDLVQIDADVFWKPDALIRLLSWNEDFVCGVYPKKCLPTSYPFGRIFHARSNGLIEVSFAPTGFMRTRRVVFEKLWDRVPKVGRDDPMAIFFERKFNGNTRDGGDVTFCRRWIAAGGKVVVDPELSFGHIGEHMYRGNLAAYLNKEENAIKHADAAIDPQTKNDAPPARPSFNAVVGDATTADFINLCNEWGNKPFAATAEFVEVAWRMAMNLPEGATVLECGSGVSTLAIASAAKQRKLRHVVLEQDGKWASEIDLALRGAGLDADIWCTPIEGDWYAKEAKAKLDNLKADMVVIDGPRRAEGIDRLWPLKGEGRGANVVKDGAAFMIDDVLSIEGAFEWEPSGTERPFVVGRVRPHKKKAA